VIVDERGRISQSIDAAGTLTGSSSVTVDKPAGATVRRAVLLAASTGASGELQGQVSLNGTAVSLGHATASSIGSFNYWTDVTSLLKPTIDAAATGALELPVIEENPSSVDGVILAVVFNDPAQTSDRSVTLLFGATQTTGDHFQLQLSKPIDPASPGSLLEMSLGISFSSQSNGTQQYSQVDVNGSRLTTSAGGEDDGEPANGGLITVGGVGDSPSNPSPLSTPTGPRSDDELYNLLPFVTAGATTVNVNTLNPSNDDNILFAAFTTNPPVTQVVTPNPTVPKAGDYVAMGDSYSSGEGTGDYLKGTDVSADRCHRSLHAYGPLLDDSLGLGTLKFVACSGAVTEDFFYRNHSNVTEKAQNASLNSSTSDVTLTIGGNDVGFAGVLTACVGGTYSNLGYGCMKNRQLVADVEARIKALGGVGSATSPEKSVRPCASGSRCRTQKTKVYSIKSLLARIHQVAPAADITVAGYPRLFGTDKNFYYKKKNAPSKYVCDVGAAPLQRTVDFYDATWMNAEQAKLNTALQTGVNDAKASGVPVKFIDPTDTFGTHAFCGATANWFNKLRLQGPGPWPGSFHPTSEGQLGYEEAISGLPLLP